MRFTLHRLQLRFTALQAIHFPPTVPGNILRGAFGTLFRQVACDPRCPGAKSCPQRATCAYARTFEPVALGDSPSGLADSPRPFVFRARHLDNRTVSAREPFEFQINLFQLHDPPIEHFTRAFAELSRAGLGPTRGRAQLEHAQSETQTISLDAQPNAPHKMRVTFLTPTELKANSQLITEPNFGALLARIRDRISTLSELYGDGPLPLDFAGFGHRAAAVRTVQHQLAQAHATRFSSRTRQRHPLDGFTGFADYEGDLAEFLPFLEAARFTGVGRQTTWGKGEIAVAPL